MAAEARLGHMHLHVSHLDEAVDFYERVIGFDLKGVSHPLQAAFLSAGGYHHHIGLNTWQGAGAPIPPADALGLDYFTILLPDEQALRDTAERIHAGGADLQESEGGMRLTDPSGHQVLLTTPTR
jgi:catechol 2,3-dioxygenase